MVWASLLRWVTWVTARLWQERKRKHGHGSPQGISLGDLGPLVFPGGWDVAGRRGWLLGLGVGSSCLWRVLARVGEPGLRWCGREGASQCLL